MIEFSRYFFWLFMARIACDFRIKSLLRLAVSGMENSVKKLIILFPHYEFSKIQHSVIELKRLATDLE